jgi:hypothetical protein
MQLSPAKWLPTTSLILTLASLLLFSALACQTAKQEAAPATQTAQAVTCAQWQSSTGPFPPTPSTIDASCANVPTDFQGTPAQSNLDLYSWVAFVALNWPAGQGCVGNPSQSILTTPPNPVWMTYLQDSDVFVPTGSKPANWCFGVSPGAATASLTAAANSSRFTHLPPKVRALAEQHPEVGLFLHYSAKASNRGHLKSLAASLGNSPLPEILQSTGDILVDQNGRWARFSIHMSQDEYGYIMSKTLWTKAGQMSAGPINMPVTPQGSLEFKAAWKILGANDDPTHFFTQQAIVYNDFNGAPSTGPNPVTVGLAGLHITHKTVHQTNWIWSTFEQVENDTKSFANPNCPASQCPPNKQTVANPQTAQELNAQGQPNYKPAQVVAVTPTSAQALNSAFQGMLKGTPWAYYQLISTQWTGEAGTAPKPPQLGNSVQETFVPPGTMYGCINCHTFATAAGKQKADFSFMVALAPQQ